METYYDREITPALAKEILGYKPNEEWEHYVLSIGEYEVAVIGYTGDKSVSYEVPERQLPTFESDNADTLSAFKEAGGSVREYTKYKRVGNLLFMLPVIVGVVLIVITFLIAK